MSNPFGSNKFKKLKAKWDKKLASTGFNDIENADGSLKASTHPRTIALALQEKEERDAYYTIASQLLHTHPFANAVEKKIWEMHCEGISIRDIMSKLKIGHHKIELVIDEMRKIGKLRRIKDG